MTFHSERKLNLQEVPDVFFFPETPYMYVYIHIHWKVSHIHIITYIYKYMILFCIFIYIYDICYTSRVIWLPVWHLIPGSAGFQKHLNVAVGRWNHLELRRCLGWFRGAAARASQGFRGYIYIHISGQIIATSHDLTPNGGLVREIPLFRET